MKIYLMLAVLLIALFWAGTRKTQAEYHHCMITMTDKTICASVKP